MYDYYYEEKLTGWTSMLNWINTMSDFKVFCMNNKMDYILFSGYAPYIKKMQSYDHRLKFVSRQIIKCDNMLQE